MDVGGTRNLQNTLVSIHGGRDGDTRVLIDGVRIGNMSGAGQWHNYVPDQGSTQELVIDYGAVSAEQISGGLRINYVPKEGGNTFRGNAFVTAVNEDWQGSNVTDDLKARGLGAPNRCGGCTTSIRTAAARSSRTRCGSTRRRASRRTRATWPGSTRT